jgi:transcriptional regulator with XRE-family HTH domain
MNAASSTRRRPTDTIREAQRLSQSIADALGKAVRIGRIRLHLTQSELAARVGVQQSWISRIELGRGQGAPLETWIALGVALGRPLAVSFSRPLGEMREPADAGHLAMQERLLTLAKQTGRSATFELRTRPSDPSRSIDVCVRDARHRVLIIEEAWNTFGDIGAATRSTTRKRAEAADLAATVDDGAPYRVASVWVVRRSATNRALLARFPGIFSSACPGSSRGWTLALTSADSPPEEPGLVWLDPSSGRVTEWRRRASPY